MNEKIIEIKEMVIEPLSAMLSKLIIFLPNVISALIIVIIGFFVAKTIEIIGRKTSKRLGINKLSKGAGMDTRLQESNITKDISDIFGKVLFWFVMFIFLMSTADTLGLAIVSDALRSIMLYIPNILASILILLFGFFIANTTRKNIRNRNIAIPAMTMASNLVYMVITVITLSLAINQLEIETALLNQVVNIVLISIGVALALSLGLGTRDVASDVISGTYIRELYRPGDIIEIDGISGTIIEIGNIKTRIEIQSKKMLDMMEHKHKREIFIPNNEMLKQRIIKDKTSL